MTIYSPCYEPAVPRTIRKRTSYSVVRFRCFSTPHLHQRYWGRHRKIRLFTYSRAASDRTNHDRARPLRNVRTPHHRRILRVRVRRCPLRLSHEWQSCLEAPSCSVPVAWQSSHVFLHNASRFESQIFFFSCQLCRRSALEFFKISNARAICGFSSIVRVTSSQVE